MAASKEVTFYNSNDSTSSALEHEVCSKKRASVTLARLSRIASGINEQLHSIRLDIQNTQQLNLEENDHNNAYVAKAMSSIGVFKAKKGSSQQKLSYIESELANVDILPTFSQTYIEPSAHTETTYVTSDSRFLFQSRNFTSSNSNSYNAAGEGQPSDTEMASNNSSKYSRNGRRGNRKKTTSLNASEAIEMVLLVNYINKIVMDHLGAKDPLRIADLKFNGTIEDLEMHAQLLQNEGLGRIVENEIRINHKNNRQSFIRMSSDRMNGERDGMISLPVARRYAFEGDVVRAFVLNPTMVVQSKLLSTATKDKCLNDNNEGENNDVEDCNCTKYRVSESLNSDSEDDDAVLVKSDRSPKAFVISIVKPAQTHQIVGSVSFKNKITIHGKNFYKMRPHDKRMPLVYIHCASFIEGVNQNEIGNFLYSATVVETDVNGLCIGELLREIGKEGYLPADLKAILEHNNLKNLQPYDQRLIDMFDEPYTPITITRDMGYREDLRKKCIFTIDPLTAKDLDDALSIECIKNGLYEVGIHISDVSHYLKEDSELDNIVKYRATSIYLANEVIHMLPKTLCSKCSLLPGLDKYAFSIFVQIDESGKVLNHRIVRTVINSCTQFAYEHAQKFIDHPKKKFSSQEFPEVHNGFTIENIKKSVLMLHNIAKEMRKTRYDNGAISINNPKLRFNFDSETGEACEFEIEQRQEANYLIEEFMLLANQIAGKSIHDSFPDTSILRNHGPPLTKGLKTIQEKLKTYGFDFDCSNSKTIFDSMHQMCTEAADPNAMYAYLCTALTKPMARASYICSKDKTPADLTHYALCIPIYTHFTSPIRRYPDIMVHRQLAAALGYSEPSKRTPDDLTELATIANEQKYNAKCASEDSAELFFKRYIKSKQSVIMQAVVYEINQHSTTVVIIKTGHVLTLNYKDQKVDIDVKCVPLFILISEKNSKLQPLRLKVFSTVDIKLAVYDNKLIGYFASPDLKQRQANTKNQAQRRLTDEKYSQPREHYPNNDNVPSTSNGRSNKNCIRQNNTVAPHSTPSNGNDEATNVNNNNANNKNRESKNKRVKQRRGQRKYFLKNIETSGPK